MRTTKKPAADGTARGLRNDLAGKLIDSEDTESLIHRQARSLAARHALSPIWAAVVAGLAFGGGAR